MKNIKIILVTAVITLAISVALQTNAVLLCALGANSCGHIVPPVESPVISLPNPHTFTPDPVLSPSELRIRAIEARLNILEAKFK